MNYTSKSILQILPLIKYPLFSSKSYKQHDNNKYAFIVDCSLTKKELKFFFESIFEIKLRKINTLTLAPKQKKVGKFWGKKALYKKAILTLESGYKIEGVFDKH